MVALSRFADVRHYAEGHPDFLGWDVTDDEVYEKLDFEPDIELWCGGPGNTKPQYIDDGHILRGASNTIPKLVLLCDYWDVIRHSSRKTWRKREAQLSAKGVVGYFSFYPQAWRWMKDVAATRMGEFICFPYACDSAFSEFSGLEKNWDVGNQGCVDGGYPFRVEIRRRLASASDISTFVVGADHQYKFLKQGAGDPLESYFHGGSPVTNYAKLLNSCWITLTDGFTKHSDERTALRLEDSDLFNARFPQTLASDSVLFCPEITSDHIEPIHDDEHYVAVTPEDFMDKLRYYLGNRNELTRISANATDWAKRNCSMDVVGQRLSDALRDVVDRRGGRSPCHAGFFGKLLGRG